MKSRHPCDTICIKWIWSSRSSLWPQRVSLGPFSFLGIRISI